MLQGLDARIASMPRGMNLLRTGTMTHRASMHRVTSFARDEAMPASLSGSYIASLTRNDRVTSGFGGRGRT